MKLIHSHVHHSVKGPLLTGSENNLQSTVVFENSCVLEENVLARLKVEAQGREQKLVRVLHLG